MPQILGLLRNLLVSVGIHLSHVSFFSHLFFFRYTMSHITSVFKEKGSDCWWELPLETLLPKEVLKKVRP